MEETAIKQLISSYDEVEVDSRSTDVFTIYSYRNQIIGLIKNGSNPVYLELRCDNKLADYLKNQYESVLTAQQLNKQRFTGFIVTGQLNNQEIIDQIRHAYEQTKLLFKD